MKFFTEADCDIASRMIGDPINNPPAFMENAGISLDRANRLLEERGRLVWGQQNLEYDDEILFSERKDEG